MPSSATVGPASARRARVLITDDEPDVRWSLATLLSREGYEPIEAADGPTALELARRNAPDVALLDLNLPRRHGLEVFRDLLEVDPGLPVVVITAHGSPDAARQVASQGAFGYLSKPFNNEDVLFAVGRAAEARRRASATTPTWAPSSPPPSFADPDPIVSELEGGSTVWGCVSSAMRRVADQVRRVAPTEFVVVVLGETGVGKEQVAQAIHRGSHRRAGPFVPVDCGALPDHLVESELFGHERGAFTGADRSRSGRFETARGGTLFLDEIGNLSESAQASLLRAIQDRCATRVGSDTPRRLDARIVVATHARLDDRVAQGRFRRDLFHRLAEFVITVPPLRERPEDIAPLARLFVAQTARELERPNPILTDETLRRLHHHSWPGNVRELRNLMRRAVLWADGDQIEPDHLEFAEASPQSQSNVATPRSSESDSRFQLGNDRDPSPSMSHDEPTGSLKEIVRRHVAVVERQAVAATLKQTGGNLTRAARLLGVDAKTLRTKARAYGLDFRDPDRAGSSGGLEG